MKNRVLIIAEAGVNHNGSIENAFKLVDAAVAAGVDIVKFQTFKAEALVTKTARTADYQKANIGEGADNQFEMLKKLEISIEDHHRIIAYCKEKGIRFFSTGFDIESIEFLRTLNLGLWKIPSGEITNLPYLEKIGSYAEPVILSTGMAAMTEIGEAVQILLKAGTPKEKLTILHCNSEYPTPMSDVNLRAMKTIGDTFGVSIGYSDHTLGVEVAIAAVAMGATVIEKHFTLDKNMSGPDHRASLNPEELKVMVSSIRNIELALGSAEKKPSASEQKNISIVRKSIIARTSIKKGDLFTKDNLTTKRPGVGISPMKWYSYIGKVSSHDYLKDELIHD